MENQANEISPNIIITNEEKDKSNENIIISENEQEIDENELIKAKKKSKKQEKSEKIIQKWLKLQKIIKEEVTLEEVILKQQNDDFNYLKDLFFQYYETKLKSRRQLDIIKKLQKNMNHMDKEYILERDAENILADANDYIKNLLFLIRKNSDYIAKIVSLIEETDEQESVESLVEFFCNQFYDNILIPNPEQEELLILIYKLLEDEITPMNSASIDDFLSESTFIGKFISSYMCKRELKVFLYKLLNPLILSIENSGLECMDLSLKNINKEVNNKKDIQNIDKNFDDFLKEIPRTSLHFKNYYLIGKYHDEKNVNNIIETTDENNDKIGYNLEYKDELTMDKIYSKIVNEKNEDIKELYLYQLEQIGNEPDLFTNSGIKLVLNDSYFHNNRQLILKKYFENFRFIKEKIDYLIQTLLDRISIIPYNIRCICKIISVLMQKKFPLLPKYLRNSFIGKIIFDKSIFPALSFDNKNIIDSRIFSQNTKKCLNVIISVLSNANKCCLFPTTTDTEKTIFNYYLIEIIPILNKFYEKVINIELPPLIEDLLNKVKLKMEQNIDNKIFNFRRKNTKVKYEPIVEEPEKKKEPDKVENEIVFDYFKNNNDEIINLECICFSIQDILFILSLINRKPKIFEGLPKYSFFMKTIERIQSNNNKLIELSREKNKIKQFYMIFKEEKNSQQEILLKNNKSNISTFASGNQDSDLICKRIKFCIKTILKGLNLLNNKDYSYLNRAISTKKFFSVIKKTLNDLSEYSEENDQIPLKWYGQYLYNNKKGLDQIYQRDDFEKLYTELFTEEENNLKELKSFSSIIITKDGMNLRCAEKLLEKVKYDLSDIEEAKKFTKIEKFIDTEKIEVCIRIKEEKEEKEEKEKNTPEKDKLPMIIISDINNCTHQKNTLDENDKKIRASSHAIFIKDFINKFHDNSQNQDKNSLNYKMRNYVTQDIINGEEKYCIYKTMKKYMSFVKKRIKDPIINEGLFNDITNIPDIADHIIRQIYKDVFPPEQKEDINF